MPVNVEVRGGTYYFRAKINGKVYRRSTGFREGGRRALELATRRAIEIANELRAGRHGYTEKRTTPDFGDWAVQFLAAYYPNRDDGSYNTEALLMRRPAIRWKERPLSDITRTDIELYFRERQLAGAKGGTLERERVLLSRCFRAAVDDEILQKNPMKGLRRFRTVPRTRVMSVDEETKLRAIISEEWQRWLTVALTTGLRLGELMALRPMDLREDGAWIYVRPESNKTRKGRLVPLRPETREALAQQAQYRGIDATPDYRYFPQTKAAAQMTLKRGFKKLGIKPGVSVHDLRRTFATRCAAAKMYPRHLQLILGHTDVSTSMKYYVHEEQQSLADAISKVVL